MKRCSLLAARCAAAAPAPSPSQKEANMASIFTVSENDLFNFESFCDLKYEDANCQKYGFFKVYFIIHQEGDIYSFSLLILTVFTDFIQIKLDESCAGQCTSLDEFKKQFSAKCLKSVRRFLLTRNPAVKNLYGTALARSSQSEQKRYVDSLLSDTTNFQVSSNCW